jgi:hypothetical protein
MRAMLLAALSALTGSTMEARGAVERFGKVAPKLQQQVGEVSKGVRRSKVIVSTYCDTCGVSKSQKRGRAYCKNRMCTACPAHHSRIEVLDNGVSTEPVYVANRGDRGRYFQRIRLGWGGRSAIPYAPMGFTR